MRNLQLNTALDKLEKKVVEKIREIHNQFIISAHEALSGLICSSISDSNVILSILKEEVTDIKNLFAVKDIEFDNTTEFPMPKRLKLRPLSELLEHSEEPTKQNAHIELSNSITNEHKADEDIERLEIERLKNELRKRLLETQNFIEIDNQKAIEDPKETDNEEEIDIIQKEIRTKITQPQVSSSSSDENGEGDESTEQSKSIKVKLNKLKRHRLHNHDCNSNLVNENEPNSEVNLAPSNESLVGQNEVVVPEQREKDHLNSCEETIPGQNVVSVPEQVVSSNKCSSCDVKFKSMTLEKIQSHLNGHRTQPFYCDVCPFVGRSTESFSEHVSSNAHSELIYQCDTCKYAYKTPIQLERHIKRDHTKASRHKCKVCGQVYAGKHFLRNHFCPALFIR